MNEPHAAHDPAWVVDTARRGRRRTTPAHCCCGRRDRHSVLDAWWRPRSCRCHGHARGARRGRGGRACCGRPRPLALLPRSIVRCHWTSGHRARTSCCHPCGTHVPGPKPWQRAQSANAPVLPATECQKCSGAAPPASGTGAHALSATACAHAAPVSEPMHGHRLGIALGIHQLVLPVVSLCTLNAPMNALDISTFETCLGDKAP